MPVQRRSCLSAYRQLIAGIALVVADVLLLPNFLCSPFRSIVEYTTETKGAPLAGSGGRLQRCLGAGKTRH